MACCLNTGNCSFVIPRPRRHRLVSCECWIPRMLANASICSRSGSAAAGGESRPHNSYVCCCCCRSDIGSHLASQTSAGTRRDYCMPADPLLEPPAFCCGRQFTLRRAYDSHVHNHITCTLCDFSACRAALKQHAWEVHGKGTPPPTALKATAIASFA